MTTTSRRLRRLAGAAIFSGAFVASSPHAFASTASSAMEATTGQASRSGTLAYNSWLVMQADGGSTPGASGDIVVYSDTRN